MSDPGLLIRDVLVDTKDGDWGRGEPTEGHSPYLVIRGTDFSSVMEGDWSRVPVRYLPDRTVHRRTLEVDDILIETAGGSPGRPTGRTMLLSQHLIDQTNHPITCASFARFLRVDREIADPRFVYWFLKSLYVSGEIEQYQVQHTGVARFQYTQFAATRPIPLPDRIQQEVVADLLGALDEKIAANQALVAATDALAHAIFLREYREIPQAEWTYGQIADINGGGTPRTAIAEYWGGDILWATPTDVTGLRAPYLRSTDRTITESGLVNCSSKLYSPGSILMTSRATIGAFAIAEKATAVNQGFIVVNAKDPVHQLWLFHEMRSRVPEYMSNANGATFMELPRGRFKSLPVALPSEAVLAKFNAQVESLHLAASSSDKESGMLADVRDKLLPQLMSGALKVRDAEKIVEAVL